MDVTFRFDLIKGKRIRWPRIEDADYIMVAGKHPAADRRAAHRLRRAHRVAGRRVRLREDGSLPGRVAGRRSARRQRRRSELHGRRQVSEKAAPETMIDAAVQDVRYACRWLARSPGFALVAILSLGLGIGFNTAIFAVADALLLRPLPVRDPVASWTSTRAARMETSGRRARCPTCGILERRPPRSKTSAATRRCLRRWRARTRRAWCLARS